MRPSSLSLAYCLTEADPESVSGLAAASAPAVPPLPAPSASPGGASVDYNTKAVKLQDLKAANQSHALQRNAMTCSVFRAV